MAVIEVPLATFTFVAITVPNRTEAPDTKPVPVIVTAVPPEVGPETGETEVTVGAGSGLADRKLSKLSVPGTFVSDVLVPALTSNLTLFSSTPLVPFQFVRRSVVERALPQEEQPAEAEDSPDDEVAHVHGS